MCGLGLQVGTCRFVVAADDDDFEVVIMEALDDLRPIPRHAVSARDEQDPLFVGIQLVLLSELLLFQPRVVRCLKRRTDGDARDDDLLLRDSFLKKLLRQSSVAT